MSKEVWKGADWLDGRYRVSNYGRIYGCYRQEILTPKIDKDGYENIVLYLDKRRRYFRVHRLVLIVFDRYAGSLYDVDHINGKRDDNRLENLRWMEKGAHVRHRLDLGHIAKGESHGKTDLKEKDVLSFKRDLLSAKCKDGGYPRGVIKSLAEKHGIPIATAYKIKEGKNWGWLNAC
jgi:hypothetical protein